MFDKSGGPNACWPWTYSRPGHRYGSVPGFLAGKRCGAHRHAYRLFYGTDPGPLSVCHECDQPICGNPRHLWAGTQRQNMLDAIAKGRYLVIGPGEYHAKAKLTDAKVAEIRAATDAADILAVRYGVVSATIRKVRAGKSWRHVA